MDAPVIVRGVVTGLRGAADREDVDRQGLPGPGRAVRRQRVPQVRATSEITYREANETVNRYAAVLAARGVGHGDVVGIMLRNSPQPVLLMLASSSAARSPGC